MKIVHLSEGIPINKFNFPDQVEIELPHGHKVTIRDLGTDVAVIMHYPGYPPDTQDIVLESVMK